MTWKKLRHSAASEWIKPAMFLFCFRMTLIRSMCTNWFLVGAGAGCTCECTANPPKKAPLSRGSIAEDKSPDTSVLVCPCPDVVRLDSNFLERREHRLITHFTLHWWAMQGGLTGLLTDRHDKENWCPVSCFALCGMDMVSLTSTWSQNSFFWLGRFVLKSGWRHPRASFSVHLTPSDNT